MHTRMLLIANERGLAEKQLAKYFVCARKNCKPRFDHWRFAEDQGISTDWLFDGDIKTYPRQSAPHKVRLPARIARTRRTHSEAVALRREFKFAMRQRIKDVAASRDLSNEDIKAVMTLKHHEIARFTEEHGVNVDWLLTGEGRVFTKDIPTSKEFAILVASFYRTARDCRQAARNDRGPVMKRRRRSVRNRQRMAAHAARKRG
jgi:hypothetical protein